MSKPTEEMKAAFRAAQDRRAEELVAEGAPLGQHDILDYCLAAVLEIGERDRPLTASPCLRIRTARYDRYLWWHRRPRYRRYDRTEPVT